VPIGFQRCASCLKPVQRCTDCGAFLSVVAHDHRSEAFLCVRCVTKRQEQLSQAGDWQADRFKASLHPIEVEPDPTGSDLTQQGLTQGVSLGETFTSRNPGAPN
jgi:recombinational DNA repair protein (RecF pathway)